MVSTYLTDKDGLRMQCSEKKCTPLEPTHHHECLIFNRVLPLHTSVFITSGDLHIGFIIAVQMLSVYSSF